MRNIGRVELGRAVQSSDRNSDDITFRVLVEWFSLLIERYFR